MTVQAAGAIFFKEQVRLERGREMSGRQGNAALLAGIFLVAWSTLITPAAGEEEKAKAEESRKEDTRTYTNEDLEQSKSSPTPPPTTDREGAGNDLLNQARHEAETRAWQRRQLESMRKEITALEARIEYWKKRQLSLRNPLYPRPTPPEGSAIEPEEEAAAGLDAATQVEQAEERIEILRKELAAARKRLAQMAQEFRKPVTPPSPAPSPQPAPRPVPAH